MASAAGTSEASAAAVETRAREGNPLGPLRRTVREIGLGLITLGVIILLFVAYQLLGTNLTEEHHQASLARQFKAAVATTSNASGSATPTTSPDQAPALPTAPPGGAIDHLVIPKIGLDKYVVEGTNEDDLTHGPGHYSGTAYPGQLGNAAIAGHRTTYGAPFFDLNQLSAGDQIKITDLQDRTWLYVVASSEVVSPGDVSVLDPTPVAQLTLTTCNPRFEATNRLIVVARLQGQAMPAPVPSETTTPQPAKIRQPTQLASDQNLGQGNSSAWFPAIAYGVAVIALWVATRLAINRTRRWRRLGAYVVGIAICLLPLWFCFENAVRLLPQNI